MGVIFKDLGDDQQEAMMQTTYVGMTWQMRYMRIRYAFWGGVATVTGMTATALTDYAIVKFTDYSGIIGWFLQ
tara:strand:+ start:335 stop:553 length:219 start_codon:yes stop_codon:yes gene_type:complete